MQVGHLAQGPPGSAEVLNILGGVEDDEPGRLVHEELAPERQQGVQLPEVRLVNLQQSAVSPGIEGAKPGGASTVAPA